MSLALRCRNGSLARSTWRRSPSHRRCIRGSWLPILRIQLRFSHVAISRGHPCENEINEPHPKGEVWEECTCTLSNGLLQGELERKRTYAALPLCAETWSPIQSGMTYDLRRTINSFSQDTWTKHSHFSNKKCPLGISMSVGAQRIIASSQLSEQNGWSRSASFVQQARQVKQVTVTTRFHDQGELAV